MLTSNKGRKCTGTNFLALMNKVIVGMKLKESVEVMRQAKLIVMLPDHLMPNVPNF